MLSPQSIDRLREDLLGAGFTLDAVQRRLGETALAALGRNSVVAALDVLADADDPQADAIRLWLLQQPVPVARLGWLALEELTAAGLLAGADARRATIELKPYGSDHETGWICSDQTPLDHRDARPRSDFVLGASPASTTLAQLIPREPVSSALDLGTGCGIQALHLAGHCDEIVATDTNDRALALAAATARLNGMSWDLRSGSLFEPVAGERFDLVVSNPPFVITPRRDDVPAYEYRDGGRSGDDLVRDLVTGVADVLAPGGRLVVVTDNVGSPDFRISRSRHWGGYHFPRHWHLYDRDTLAATARAGGLEVESVATVVSPVNWVYSLRNMLVDLHAPSWMVRPLSLEGSVALAAGTALDSVFQLAGRGALLRGVFRRPAD